ncbi:MAG: hypothetical protein ACRC1K_06790 [Planctomycetia bacterium]
MDELTLTNVLLRWIHIGSAVTLVGGTVFTRFVVLPAAAPLPADVHDEFKTRLVRRWAPFVHALILLLLASGITVMLLKIRSMPPVYHALLGLKILLALSVMFFASALVGRSKGLQKFRDQAKIWLTVNVVLAVLIVMLSGVLRYVPKKASAAAPTAAPAVTADPSAPKAG